MAPFSIGRSTFLPVRLSTTVTVGAAMGTSSASGKAPAAGIVNRAAIHFHDRVEQRATLPHGDDRRSRDPRRTRRRRERRAHVHGGGAGRSLAARRGRDRGKPRRDPEPREAADAAARGDRACRDSRRVAFEGARPGARRRPLLPRGRRAEAARGPAGRGRAETVGADPGVRDGAGRAMTPAMDDVHYRVCPLCEATCGLEIRTRGREVVGIRGDEADPFSRGFICPKGYALKELDADPDRLRTPFVRRDGVLRPASWEEAFAEIEGRLGPILRDGGRDAVGVYVGNPAAHNMALILYGPVLARALGSRNFFSASTVDQMPKHVSAGLV